jgi:hypothetical protein
LAPHLKARRWGSSSKDHKNLMQLGYIKYGISRNLNSRVFVVGRGLGKGFSLKKESIAFGKG